MSNLEYGHQIEIYYGLHGGPPVLIGGGSGEDLEAACAEAERVNAEATDLGPGNHASPGTEAFYRHMGATAGVSHNTEAALAHYQSMVDGARDAVREVFAGGNAGKQVKE
jgi:hypothetical protein